MFNTVYQISTEERDFNSLKKKLKNLHLDAVTIKNGMFVNAGAQLALEGKHKKVEWLRLLGASINTIAQGYALAGNHDLVEIYREKFGANISMIAEGYAIIGDHEHTQMYLTKYQANVNYIAHGYAIAGNHEYVEKYRKLYGADINYIAHGYALAGNDLKVESYIYMHNADSSVIAHGYAITGQHSQVENLFTQSKADVNVFIAGYVVAGNHDYVEAYRTLYNADVNVIVKHYAASGNHEYVKLYQKHHNVSLESIAEGYELAENHAKRKQFDLCYLLDNYVKTKKLSLESTNTPEDLNKPLKVESFNCLTFFSKNHHAKLNAISALKKAIASEETSLHEHLPYLRKGSLGQELRKFINDGTADHLVGKEVKTIREFVKALQLPKQ